jgi:hypothetical protein
MFGSTFYHESVRKVVVAFGSLFDEISVQRRDSSGNVTKKILVPIMYAAQEKFIRMLNEYPSLRDGETHLAAVLPRMGFSMTSINYDGTRKRNTVQKRFNTSTTTGVHETQFAEVPYNIGFQLTIAARTMDDALQIVEQILPFFTPEFTMSLNYTDFNTKVDLPIVLQSVNPEIEYEGDLTTQRSIIFTLDFNAQTYIFAPTKTSKYIKTTDINILNSHFLADGSVAGPTGAASRIITSVTGASGINTLPPNAGITQRKFVYDAGLSITGGTYG